MTELAAFRVTTEGVILEELQDGAELETVKEKTEASFKVNPAILKAAR
ncbi:hypothetical protein KW850_12795 [Bacillus sp. sid0103]|nr:hypothetical protein [Bacillus sp. sid0103]MBV7506135.1 hypothetical protein [Bacillus sp. sid0103]